MKKTLLVIFLLITYQAGAQWLPLDPLNSLTYSSSPTSKQFLVIDSMAYVIRSGGLEELNATNSVTGYHWSNYYQVNKIVADTGKTYVYLKNSNYIGRYNKGTARYENIWPDSLRYKQIADIDVSSDGEVWATTINYSKEIAVYNGATWKFFPVTLNIYSGFSNIKVVNDTLAYLFGGYYYYYKFHNGVFDSLYNAPSFPGYNFKDMDADNFGNLWIAAQNKLIHIADGVVTSYDSSNTTIHSDQFLHVKIANDGSVWVAGVNHLLLYNGATIAEQPLPGGVTIENLSLHSNSQPWLTSNYSDNPQLFMFDGNSWSNINFPFAPLENIKAIGSFLGYDPYFSLATPQGIFNLTTSNYYYNYNYYFTSISFTDSSYAPYANDVICFTDNDPNTSSPTFGTHHGVSSLAGFNNSKLPNDTVNHICYDNGTYYIATNKGLVAYNGLLYNIIDTSNSPVPSNKITYVSTGNNFYCNNTPALYVGTDKGLAIYQNGVWSVYDKSTIPVNSFYVTGIMEVCYDTGVYITTAGAGLIKVYPHGSYELYNTSNGKILDDSLYYIENVQLGDCGSFDVVGTAHHGFMFTESYQADNFNYDTLYNNVSIKNSRMITRLPATGEYIAITDSLSYILTPCGAVKKINPGQQLAWIQDGNQLVVTVPENFFGEENILLTDVLGQAIIQKSYNISTGRINMDVSNLTTGVYFVRINGGDKMAYSKVIIYRN